jgi:uncharacterized SAM-binding protein YcdF (DUF218 family)
MTRRRAVFGTLLVLAVVMAAGFAWVVHLVRSPSTGAIPGQADAIVVFAGEQARVVLALRLVDEGRADVLVVSDGEANPQVSGSCGQQEPVRVLCPRPDPLDTRGEARMFARLAQENGWHDLIAVTGDYHLTRARLLLDRCWDGHTTFAPVRWAHVGIGPVLHEIGGLAEAESVQRGC